MGTAGQDRTRGTFIDGTSPAGTAGQLDTHKLEEIELKHMKFNHDSNQSSGPVIGRDKQVRSGNGYFSGANGMPVPLINLEKIKESPMKIDTSQTSPD
jgi:hypothetical protein